MTIIDLRTTKELLKRPNYLNNKLFNYYNIDIIDGSFNESFKIDDNVITSNEDELVNSYMCMLSNGKKINEIFKIMASSKNGILFNCSAGKDRTGVIAFLLLMLANCYEEDIVSDYSLSYIYLKRDIDKKRKNNKNLSLHYGRSDADYMFKLISLFLKKYKDFKNYIKVNDLNLKYIQKIKENFLDDIKE